MEFMIKYHFHWLPEFLPGLLIAALQFDGGHLHQYSIECGFYFYYP